MSNSSNAINADTLCAYLEEHVEGFHGPLSAEKFSGGQSNPTYLISAKSGQYVLRRQPSGKLLKSAHAVDREFRVQKALALTEVPVSKVYHLCEDRSVIGSMFYLMQYMDGDIFWSPELTEVPTSQRANYYSEMINIMASLHNVDLQKVGLEDYGKPGSYFQRQSHIWTKQYRDSETETINAMENLLSWIETHCPEDDGVVSLVHGDFHFDNIIFNKKTAKGLAVIDWELSTLGNPLADLAFFCMCLRLPDNQLFRGLQGKNRRDLGIPEEQQLVEHYCMKRNLSSISHWHFYLAFSFFRLAAILQGVLKRSLDGNASNQYARQMGEMVAPLANMALAVINEE